MEKRVVFSMKKYLKSISKVCAYSQVFIVFNELVQKRKIPAEARGGAYIAIAALFCPLFWGAVLMGAEASAIIFHAVHSGIVFLIGVGIMVVGYLEAVRTKTND